MTERTIQPGKTPGNRVLEIDPLTRVEGHGKVTIHLDADNQVSEARLHIVEFRGFERFIQGRLLWEVPVIVQRLCGICPVSHHLCAAKAMDQIVGVDQLPPTAEKMRRLMHYGQILQSNVLHFFHLASPDLLFGFDAPARQRNIFEVIKKNPELARQGVLMRQFGQEIIEATAGKKIHGTGAIPGGINKALSQETRDALLPRIDTIQAWAEGAVDLIRDYCQAHPEQIAHFANFPSNAMSLLREDGAMELYDGKLYAVDTEGQPIFSAVAPADFNQYLMEEVRSWSYMKFPFIRSLGSEQGWYRVGPLARMNTARFISTPAAQKRLLEYRHLNGGANGETNGKGMQHASLLYHWARMIEVLHCVEQIHRLLEDPDILSGELRAKGERREEGIAIIEAPRGSLFHHYRVDKNDQITYCNLIVSTTHNNSAMNRAVTEVAQRHLSGQKNITEGLLNHIEVAVRAYDPCLSCATHALGQMPLQVAMVDATGKTIQQFTRDSGHA